MVIRIQIQKAQAGVNHIAETDLSDLAFFKVHSDITAGCSRVVENFVLAQGHVDVDIQPEAR